MKVYSYYMTQRPPMPGAMPRKGLVGIEEFYPPEPMGKLERVYARLQYERELSEREVYEYELVIDEIQQMEEQR